MEKNTTTSAVKKKRFVLEMSTPEAAGWAALVIFVCGWFFILGIFVGRGLVPVPGETAPDRPYFAKTETPSPEPPAASGSNPPSPAGQDAAKTQPPAAVAEADQPPPDKTVPDKAAPVPPADEKASASATEPTPAAPAPGEKSAGKAVTAPPARKDSENKTAETGEKIFTIQVAAVRDRRAADQCYEKLKKQRYAPDDVQTVQSGGVTWYRLRCGQFADREEAAPVIERLRKDGFSPILVRR